jgi:hypothetical protein
MSEKNHTTPWVQAVGARIKEEPIKAFGVCAVAGFVIGGGHRSRMGSSIVTLLARVAMKNVKIPSLADWPHERKRKDENSNRGRVPVKHALPTAPDEELIDIEIQFSGNDLSEVAIDDRIRQLAEKLRELPHKTVGINSKPLQEVTDGVLGPTEGTIAASVPASSLPAVIILLQNHPNYILKGPNATQLDFRSSLEKDQIDSWLVNASKGKIRSIPNTEN